MSDGPSFYDNATVFSAYRATRTGPGDLNARVEAPTVDELVGDVRGLDVLELGCGDGSYGAALLSMGARTYTGLEGSRLMCAAARRRLAGLSDWHLLEERLEDWKSNIGAYDLVVSRMALHYVDDLPPLLRHIRRALRGAGRLVVSVEHPVVTSHYASNPRGSIPSGWTVTEYFVSGARTSDWLGAEVLKYHRTIEEWWAVLADAGFVLATLRAGDPRSYKAQGVDPAVEPRRLVPMYLMLATHPV